ncbi:peroxiredoxin-5, mitochondrial-like [Dysidea avara]|uniref:peroxiredoxin-5, mitochondrial-like n=1 Tax=Dysidea avara TaxID=196820 RepID=UPI00332BBDAF
MALCSGIGRHFRAAYRPLLFSRSIRTSGLFAMPIEVGDKLPSVDVFEGTPNNKVNIQELFSKVKKGVLFAVPGAFTPGCSKTHLPGFVSGYDKLKEKGVEVVACVSVNDPFVMAAWGESAGAEGKVRMLADTCAEFTKAIEMDLDATKFLGNVRSKRYTVVIENGMVREVMVEPDGTGLTCTLFENILDRI